MNIDSKNQIKKQTKQIMKSLKFIITSLFIITSVMKAEAQQALPATAGKAVGSGGNSNYTVGLVAYTTQKSFNGSVISGVQQPFEISVTLGLEEAKGVSLQSIVYPNPTTKGVTLKIENYDITNLSYLIFDINGRNIENKNIKNNETYISMENLAKSTYFIKIMNLNKELKIFKIIKKD